MKGEFVLVHIMEIQTHVRTSFLIGLDAIPMVLAMVALAIFSPGKLLHSGWAVYRPFSQATDKHETDLYNVGPLLAKQRRRQLAEKNGTLAPELNIENQNVGSESDQTLAEEEAVMKQEDQKLTHL